MFHLSFVRRLVALTGVLLVLGTFIFPFLGFRPFFLQIPEYKCDRWVDLWSFRRRDTAVCLRYFGYNGFTKSVYDFWFCDYWFVSLDLWMDYREQSYQQQQKIKNEVAWTLISLFAVQTINLTAAIASIFISKKTISLIPAILCPITTIIMLAVFIHLHQATWNKFNYQLGYWLTYPSEATFIANTLIEAKIKRNLTQEKPHAINSVNDD